MPRRPAQPVTPQYTNASGKVLGQRAQKFATKMSSSLGSLNEEQKAAALKKIKNRPMMPAWKRRGYKAAINQQVTPAAPTENPPVVETTGHGRHGTDQPKKRGGMFNGKYFAPARPKRF